MSARGPPFPLPSLPPLPPLPPRPNLLQNVQQATTCPSLDLSFILSAVSLRSQRFRSDLTHSGPFLLPSGYSAHVSSRTCVILFDYITFATFMFSFAFVQPFLRLKAICLVGLYPTCKVLLFFS